tara:strand:+ start:234 stop:704 length:471 start_codon:yes stop_codon:yes gene_type:complete
MFRLHKNARKWGYDLVHNKNIGPIKIEFDLYYIFLLVGLGLGKSEPLEEGQSEELLRNYPKPYQQQRHKIALLLLYCDLKASGFDITNKTIVKSKIEEMLSTNSQNLLTDQAGKLLNNYANGGFEAIREVMATAETDSSLFISIIYEEFFPKLFIE